MNSDFINNALTRGSGGQAWLEQIPQLIRTYESLWGFKALPPYNLSYNYVAPVVVNDGSEAVLKIGIPEDEEFKTEINALAFYGGKNSVKLLKEDKAKAVILIEKIDPGVPLSTLSDDGEATHIVASIMKKLWKPLPNNHRFIDIRDWIKALYEYPSKFRNNFPISLELAHKATLLFEELIETSEPAVLIHGDLHHDNILSSKREDWLVIDPKGIAAEPAYETATMIRNPYKKLMEIDNLEELLKKRVILLSEELKFDPVRIQKWCLAETVLTGVWAIENTKFASHSLRVARALDKIEF